LQCSITSVAGCVCLALFNNVKRHFPFSSTRFNAVPLLESVCLLSLNMFTSLHDARSASTNEKHASQGRKHFVLSVRCGHAQSATVGM
jgi:hypothetical protein